MLPDVYLLRQFALVMEKRSYTRASAQMHLSRQALTKNIQKMEAMLGGALFIPQGKTLVPTDLALTLERHARPLLQAWRQFEAAMEAEEDGQWLSLSLSHGISTALGQRPSEAFHELYPQVRLNVEESSCEEVLAQVDRGEAQVGLLGTHPEYLEGYHHLCLRTTGVWLLMPLSSPLAQKKEILPRDLEGVPLCGTGRRNHLQRFFTEGCEAQGITPSFSFITTYPERSGLLPEDGIYFGMPPAIAPAPPGWTVRRLILPGEEAFGTYAICRQDRPLSPLAKAFWTFLQDRYRPG